MKIDNKYVDFLNAKKEMVRRIQHWAIGLFIIEIFLLYMIDYLIPNQSGIFKAVESSVLIKNFIDTIKSLTIEILPITAIAIFIHPIIDQFKEIENIIEKDEQKIFFSKELLPIKSNLNSITDSLNSFGKYREIYSIDYSYNETNWPVLLKNAKSVTICMLYTGTHWNRKYLSNFEDFINNGGKLKLYLPNASEIKSQFFNTTSMSKVTSDKIFRTINLFRKIDKNNKIEIKTLNKGFHYMFARVEKQDFNIFLFSPYPNNYDRNEAPVIAFNEKYINKDMRNFINKEIEYLTEDSTTFPDLELEKYIIWRKDRNRVFISTDLYCQEKCKFCYVDSLIERKSRHKTIKLARMICDVVRNDERFVKGLFGTTIMLSSFSDPFHKSNIDATIEIINFFSIYKNFIDIATRFPLTKKEDLLPSRNNLIINFSLASLEQDIEVNNQYQRFEDAKKLISKGYSVLLYLRPVIQNVTIKKLDEIISLITESGIKEITIGGLYVDKNITDKLSQININVSKYSKINKQFVLDDKSILKKLQIDDLDIIYEKLQNAGFRVFLSSDQRIEYYKNKFSKIEPFD